MGLRWWLYLTCQLVPSRLLGQVLVFLRVFQIRLSNTLTLMIVLTRVNKPHLKRAIFSKLG